MQTQSSCSCSKHVTTRHTTFAGKGAAGRPRGAQVLGWAGWFLGCLAARPSIACSDTYKLTALGT